MRKISQHNPFWTSERIGYFNENEVNVHFMYRKITKCHVHSETDEILFVLNNRVVIETKYTYFPLPQNDFVNNLVNYTFQRTG